MNDVKRVTRDFTPEFKVQAAKLVIDTKISVSQAAEDLGMSASTLHGWINKFRSGQWDIATGLLAQQNSSQAVEKSQTKAITSVAQSVSDKARIQELERLNRRLTLERDILKKAMAYCVDVPR